MNGPAGAIGGLFVGSPGLPSGSPPLPDPIVLTPGSEVAMALGLLGTPLAAHYLVPPLPQLLGTPVAWQGVSLVGASLEPSNGVTYVQW